MTRYPEEGAAGPEWDAAEHADWLYDALSEALRDHVDVFPDTDAAFTALDQWLRSSGVLPGPWRNAARDADE